ncbi:MAG: LamB/YcsF family protein [Acidobacteriota bacterium]
MKQLGIDLNSDVGEGYGPYKIGNDEELFPYITSANIACGFHAGDPTVIRKTLDLAAKHGVAVGAHPGYPDRLHFGRVALPYPPEEVVDMILYQIGALQILAERAGLKLQHVKLHGALYHTASEDRRLAEMFLDAIVRLPHPPIVVGQPESLLNKEAEERGVDFAAEGFADRVYGDDGKLIPRSSKQPATISDPSAAAEQAFQLVKERKVQTISGRKIEMKVSTICIHGDTPGAAKIARGVFERLQQAKITIQALTHLID